MLTSEPDARSGWVATRHACRLLYCAAHLSKLTKYCSARQLLKALPLALIPHWAAVARRTEAILRALSLEHSLIGKTSKWGTWRHVSEKRLRSNSLRLKCRGWNIYQHVEILSVQLGNQCSHAMKLDSSDGQMVTRRRRLCSKISHGNVALVGEKLPSLNKETQVKIIAFSLASNCLSLVPY